MYSRTGSGESYGMVTVKTAVEKPMRMEILGLSVDALFINLVNSRQSPSGSTRKEMKTRSEGSNLSSPFGGFNRKYSTVQEPNLSKAYIATFLITFEKIEGSKRCTNF
jgi:hypothetical protein